MGGRDLVDWGDGERTSYVVPSETSNTIGLVESGGTQLTAGEAAAFAIEAAVSDPHHLNTLAEGLPDSLKAKMIETLNIPPMKRGAVSAEKAFLSRLTAEEREAYHDWVESLADDERQAILSWFNAEFRR
jgi:hypothetical protein